MKPLTDRADIVPDTFMEPLTGAQRIILDALVPQIAHCIGVVHSVVIGLI